MSILNPLLRESTYKSQVPLEDANSNNALENVYQSQRCQFSPD